MKKIIGYILLVIFLLAILCGLTAIVHIASGYSVMVSFCVVAGITIVACLIYGLIWLIVSLIMG